METEKRFASGMTFASVWPKVSDVRHSPSLQPLRFCSHPVRADMLGRSRHRQFSIAHDRQLLLALAGVLVNRLGHDVADRPAGRTSDKIARTGSDPRRADPVIINAPGARLCVGAA